MSRQWTTCCSKTDISFVRYIVHVTACFAVLIFAFVAVFMDEKNIIVWTNLISAIVGYLIPGPTHSRRSTPSTPSTSSPSLAKQEPEHKTTVEIEGDVLNV
jgi:hypothetical protein